jgi:cysteinyl-tRNA synthetase
MAAFFEDIDTLNFRRAEAYPRATDYIEGMIELTKRLVDSGHAYVVNGNVYYDLMSFPDYGRLSGNTIENLDAGARVAVIDEKRHPADFALWKQDENHIMKWDSPFGVGFPGWHLECSVMAMSLLGETLDIHTGGEDNVFPHHESEIAQSEAATGRPFVRYWVHGRFLLVDGEKMAKSRGNFYTVRDLLERGYHPMAIRFALIAVQHTQQMNFTLAGLDEAAKNLERVRELVRKLAPDAGATDKPDVESAVESAIALFDAGIDDDLNISVARAAFLGLVSDVNRIGLPLSPGDAKRVRDALDAMDEVLGLRLTETGDAESPDAEVERWIEERLAARAARDFTTSDRIRDELAARGIVLFDTPDGTTWRRRS